MGTGAEAGGGWEMGTGAETETDDELEDAADRFDENSAEIIKNQKKTKNVAQDKKSNKRKIAFEMILATHRQPQTRC